MSKIHTNHHFKNTADLLNHVRSLISNHYSPREARLMNKMLSDGVPADEIGKIVNPDNPVTAGQVFNMTRKYGGRK